MKKLLSLPIVLCALTVGLGHSQIPGQAPMPAPVLPPRVLKGESNSSGNEAPKLTKFNLDFPGGTPQQLVAAIEKATGRPLNVIIPDEYANESIPALRMSQVSVSDLFRAMEIATVKSEPYRSLGVGGTYSQFQLRTALVFQTAGPINDDAIWHFRGRDKVTDYTVLDKKPAPAKLCRFYALNPYLEQGIKLEDITTAIQTGWKMLGDNETPTISFHKETKLLIAVGETGKLETIDAVLTALRPGPGYGSPQSGLFGDRVRELIIQQANAPAPVPTKTNVATPKPAAIPESKP